MTLVHLLGAAPERDDLLVHDGTRVASGEIDERALVLAGALNARGIGPGDHVAFQLPIGVDSVVVYRACWMAGVVAVALHPLAGRAQVSAALDQLEPSLLISAPGYELAANPEAVEVADLRDGAAHLAEAGPDDDALVIFTSGSSGAPKGVIHTHGSLSYKVAESVEVHGLNADDAVLMPAPLAHVSGLLHGVLVPGAVGMKTVLMSKWDPGIALDLIEREQVTYMVGPPTFFVAMIDHPEFSSERVSSLRLISCGGAGVAPAFVDHASASLGAVVKRAYGSTEAPTVTTSHHTDPPERMANTDGRAFGETKLRVDEGGELWVTGPELARGYLDPAATADAFVDGWFRTGDTATLDDDGWLTITGRLGDVIIRGGENISTIEVEQHLEAHPAVSHAIAVAAPHDRLGETVAAFVVAPDGFDVDTCQAWFHERGATVFTCPEQIVLIDEIPLLASGKADRAALRGKL